LAGLAGPDAARWQMAGVNGLAEGMGRRGVQLSAFLSRLSESAKPTVKKTSALLDQAARLAGDHKRPPGERVAAVRLLAHAGWKTAAPALEQLIEDEASQEVRLAAVRALAAHPRAEVGPALLKSWRTYTPAVRREALEAMLRQPDRIGVLLDEV